MSLFCEAIIVFTRTAVRPDHRLEFDRKLPAGGRQRMIDSLRRAGLVVEIDGVLDPSADTETGLILTNLVLTDTRFRAIGKEPPVQVVAEKAAAIADTLDASVPLLRQPVVRSNLLALAARAVLDDYKVSDESALSLAMDDLANALTARAKSATTAPRIPRQGTEQQTVLDRLRRPDGDTIAQIIDGTSWQSHTVRGFLTAGEGTT